MPRILEMKAEKGELWVRVGMIESMSSPVHLWTDAEREDYRRRCRQEILDEIQEKIGVN